MANEKRTDRRSENDRQERAGAARESEAIAPQGNDLSAKDMEALETDGKGTGGAGADAGGYGPVRGSDATG